MRRWEGVRREGGSKEEGVRSEKRREGQWMGEVSLIIFLYVFNFFYYYLWM